MQRRTKIVATLGPSTDDPKVLDGMIQAGVDVVRVNFSHGTSEEHLRRAENVRNRARAHGRQVGVLADLQGPRFRVGRLPGGAMELVEGDLSRDIVMAVQTKRTRTGLDVVTSRPPGEDGYFMIVGREKDLVITGGFNVFPKEIEDVISAHPAVAMVAVIGVPEEKWGEAVKAVVELRAGATSPSAVFSRVRVIPVTPPARFSRLSTCNVSSTAIPKATVSASPRSLESKG